MSEIPGPIKEVFGQLKSEITSLHARWKIYRQLFAHSDERSRLLNKTAPTFFFFIHEVLIDHIQLSIGKLTDSAHTGDKENLSLHRLHEQVEKLDDADLSSKLKEILVDLCGQRSPKKSGKCEIIRTRRNKRIAHFDLNTSIQHGSDPLPGVSRQMIEDVLALLRQYMNTIQGHYCNNAYLYNGPAVAPHDTETLVALLEDGLELRRSEIELLAQLYRLSE
jgi:hypothetical protein